MAGGLAVLSALTLSGCSIGAPPRQPTPKLVVDQVVYDCPHRSLMVSGHATPARAGQQVQVQVRIADGPGAPVWRITTTDAQGRFTAEAKYAVAESTPIELWVKAASVVGGNRVFSKRATQPLRCP